MDSSQEELWTFSTIKEFLPVPDEYWNRTEFEASYIECMEIVLPDVPEEVLREWFFRHWNDPDDYVGLDFKTSHFERQRWPLHRIPDHEALATSIFSNISASDVARRLKNKHDWLVHYYDARGHMEYTHHSAR